MFFFFNDTSTTEIYTLSLHDALPICSDRRTAIALVTRRASVVPTSAREVSEVIWIARSEDRKSTRLNSSHSQISYAVFCLKKKKKNASPHLSDLYDTPPPLITSTPRS